MSNRTHHKGIIIESKKVVDKITDMYKQEY